MPGFSVVPLLLFGKGLAVGVSASAPMGPMGVLCVERTLRGGKHLGLASGFGIALADTLFAIIALVAFTRIADFIETYSFWVRLFGGLIILALGLQMARPKPVSLRTYRMSETPTHGPRAVAAHILHSLLLTLTNPFCILIFLALYAFFRIEVDPNLPVQALLALLGVHLGAMLWWFLLTRCIDRLRRALRLKHIIRFSRISGLVIALLGLATTVSAFLNTPLL